MHCMRAFGIKSFTNATLRYERTIFGTGNNIPNHHHPTYPPAHPPTYGSTLLSALLGEYTQQWLVVSSWVIF